MLRGGILCLILLLPGGLCLAWIYVSLVHAVMVSVSSAVHHPPCVWKMLFSCCHPLSLALTIFWPHHLHRFMSLESRGLIKTPHLRLSVLRSLMAQCRILGVCINYCLLKEVFLMRAEQGTEICVVFITFLLLWKDTIHVET